MPCGIIRHLGAEFLHSLRVGCKALRHEYIWICSVLYIIGVNGWDKSIFANTSRRPSRPADLYHLSGMIFPFGHKNIA
jgi:hypothetical protein